MIVGTVEAQRDHAAKLAQQYLEQRDALAVALRLMLASHAGS